MRVVLLFLVLGLSTGLRLKVSSPNVQTPPSQSRGESLYSNLGLPKTASKLEIRRAFDHLTSTYHPDKNPAAEAYRIFVRACHAFEVLSGLKRVNQDEENFDPENLVDDWRPYVLFHVASLDPILARWAEGRQGRRWVPCYGVEVRPILIF